MPYPKEDTVRFVSVMRIMKDKGIEELLEAARRIHEKHPETVFELLGAYEEETRARYEPMIEDLAIQRDCALLWLPGRYAGVLPALSGGNPSVLSRGHVECPAGGGSDRKTGDCQRYKRLPGDF